MATVTFTLSSADLTRMVNALSVRFGYQATLPDGSSNPQAAGEFVRLKIANWAAQETQNAEVGIARAAVTATPVVVS